MSPTFKPWLACVACPALLSAHPIIADGAATPFVVSGFSAPESVLYDPQADVLDLAQGRTASHVVSDIGANPPFGQ